MSVKWPPNTDFHEISLDNEVSQCPDCGEPLSPQSTRTRAFYQLTGPTKLACHLVWCRNRACSAYHHTRSPDAEKWLSLPRWGIGWDVLLWIGFRRFKRHWSLPQIQAELWDSYHIRLAIKTLATYVRTYQVMVSAYYQDLSRLRTVYQKWPDVILSIDGIQPEKGHEAVYVVRELRAQRVWFAEALLSSATAEIQALIQRARHIAKQLDKPVYGWISDKQDAFVTAIEAEFPGVPHRLCTNHFIRDAAELMLALDSTAKVQMRHKVRELRALERACLESHKDAEPSTPFTKEQQRFAAQIVLTYCAAVRGILNDNHGGPLCPAGWRMAGALEQIHRSLTRTLTRPATPLTPLLQRLHDCLNRGLTRYSQDVVRVGTALGYMHVVWALLQPKDGRRQPHRKLFQHWMKLASQHDDHIIQHIGHLMERFEDGLFCGGDEFDLPDDNLDLERWIKGPKGHERRIHGRQHVGLRIVIEAPTFLVAFDAHLLRTTPFTVHDLLPYASAEVPESQQRAVIRHQIMRKARSQKKRGCVLEQLEQDYEQVILWTLETHGKNTSHADQC